MKMVETQNKKIIILKNDTVTFSILSSVVKDIKEDNVVDIFDINQLILNAGNFQDELIAVNDTYFEILSQMSKKENTKLLSNLIVFSSDIEKTRANAKTSSLSVLEWVNTNSDAHHIKNVLLKYLKTANHQVRMNTPV